MASLCPHCADTGYALLNKKKCCSCGILSWNCIGFYPWIKTTNKFLHWTEAIALDKKEDNVIFNFLPDSMVKTKQNLQNRLLPMFMNNLWTSVQSFEHLYQNFLEKTGILAKFEKVPVTSCNHQWAQHFTYKFAWHFPHQWFSEASALMQHYELRAWGEVWGEWDTLSFGKIFQFERCTVYMQMMQYFT